MTSKILAVRATCRSAFDAGARISAEMKAAAARLLLPTGLSPSAILVPVRQRVRVNDRTPPKI